MKEFDEDKREMGNRQNTIISSQHERRLVKSQLSSEAAVTAMLFVFVILPVAEHALVGLHLRHRLRPSISHLVHTVCQIMEYQRIDAF